MKTIIKIFVVFSLFLTACEEAIDYKKDFTDGEEIRYAAKVNDLTYFAGKNRVMLQYVLGADPNINKSVIYWNLKKDTVEVNIDRTTMNSDTISVMIDNLLEGIFNFEIYNYDKFGNSSVPEYITVKTYGKRFQSSLYNRDINTSLGEKNGFFLAKDTVSLVFLDSLRTSKDVFIEYVDNKGNKRTTTLINTRDTVSLPEIKENSVLSLKTRHIPEYTAIDIFETIPIDVEVPLFSEMVKPELIAKPYSGLYIENFDSPNNDNWDSLWDGKWGKTYSTNAGGDPWGNEAGWTFFQTTESGSSPTATWLTIDVKEYINLARYRTGFYWPYMNTCPKKTELWAYVGEGVPTAQEGWENWVKLGAMDNSAVNKETAYGEGDNLYFANKEAPMARYYRLKCLENWKGSPDMIIAEVTFWGYP